MELKTTKILKTDWIGSESVFYNQKTCKVSTNINDVIDFANLEFDPEGLKNYLEFGFSVFGQTPVKNVKILNHSSSIQVLNNKLVIKRLSDPVLDLIEKSTKEIDIIEKLRQKINNWEDKVKSEIIIPTSGGYDSRMLNFLVKDKSRIRSFTYGISENQNNSSEVVYARELSKKIGTKWQQIELGKFHNYFGLWNDLFGPSTHAHGMYQIEFYSKIKDKIGNKLPLLSGIIGDAWAGSVEIKPIQKIEDLVEIGYIHDLNADKTQCALASSSELKEQYFSENKHNFKNKRWMVVESMRFKMILLSYLIRVPQFFGFESWSPFLDMDIALGMLCLPQNRRKGRIWEKEFFEKNDLDFESKNLRVSENSTLDLQARDAIKLKPLDINLLREIIKVPYVEWINKNISGYSIAMKIQRLSYSLFDNLVVGDILRSFGFSDRYNFIDTDIRAYSAYLTLKPLEELLIKRNKKI